MVRFLSSGAQNQEQLRKIREQYQYLLRKQNEANDQGAPYEDELKFDSVRELLKDTTSPNEMNVIVRKIDTDFNGRVSFEEFSAAFASQMGEQDEAILRSAFLRLDVNGDKYLTMDEIFTSLGQGPDSLFRVKKTQGFMTELKNFLTQNDIDGNKKLDEAEFI